MPAEPARESAAPEAPPLRRIEVHQDLESVRAAVRAVMPLFGADGAIAVTARPNADRPLRDGLGWLPEGARDADFAVINPEFRGTAIEALLEKLPFPFGRARLLRLAKKSCLSIHWDSSLRYHYAVFTNPACYLVFLDGEIGRFHHIPADGWLYQTDTRRTHTAINASREERIHLVICDARDEGRGEGRPDRYAGLAPSR